MATNFFTPAVSDQVMAALCNTLVYSLLQGVLLAAVAGLVVVCTRKVSSAARYNLLIGVLLLFVAASATTFVVQLNSIDTNAPVAAAKSVSLPKSAGAVFNPSYYKVTSSVVTIAPAAHQNYVTTAKSFLDTHHNIIVLIWFAVICLQSIRLAMGLQGVYKLKKTNVTYVTAGWKVKLNGMAESLGIKQKIALLESGLAKVPMTIGYLRPVILMPIGLLTALSMAEVEAILLHELAHIRRRDYLVNLLQGFVEIIFFFNPAVLWVSALIKTERENCCDDIALAQSSNKKGYIQALVICEEYQQTGQAYAMAFPGQQNGLVSRVTRMVTNNNNSISLFEKTLLTICMVVAGLGFSAYKQKENIKKVAKAIVSAITIDEKPVRTAPVTPGKKIVRSIAVDTTKKIAAIDEKKFTHIVTGRNLSVSKPFIEGGGKDSLIEINLDNSYAVRNLNLRKRLNDSTLNQRYQVWLAELKQQRAPVSENLSGTDLDAWYDRKIAEAKNNSSAAGTSYSYVSSSTSTITTALSSLHGVNSRYNALVYLDSMDRAYYDYKVDRGRKTTDNLRHIPRTAKEHMAFELAKDGIIASDETSMKEFTYTFDRPIKVNGTPLSDELSKKYRTLFDRHTNNPKYAAEPVDENRHVLNRIILQIVNDGIISKDDGAIAGLKFDLNDKGLTVNGVKQPLNVFKKYYDAFLRPVANDEVNWAYGN